MSSLLKEAIIDASALKAAALKNAESAIIAKYSNEVKDTIDKLLEQDELDLELGGPLSGEEMGDPGLGEDPAVAGAEDPAMDLGGDLGGMGAEPMEEVEEVTEDNIPLGASNGLSKEVGVNLEKAPAEGEAVEFNLDLGALHEAIQELKSELEEDEEIEINEEDLEAMFELETLIDPEEEDDGVDSGEALAGSAAAAKADTDAMDAAGLEELTMGPGRTTQKPLSTAQNQVHADKRYDKRKTEKDPKKAVKEEEKDERWRDWKPGGDTGTPRPRPDDEDETSPQQATADQVRGKWDNVDEEISEDLIDAIMEKLTVDMGASLSGWAGRSSESMRWEIEKALAHRRSSDFKEDFEDIKKAHDELVFENNQLKEHTKQYKETLTKLKESLQDINLSNGRLLYTNRVLRNTSLNERQKEKIVEAISNAGSVTEAKTIYNTLQSTMETKRSKPSPQSLSEAIGRSPSFIRASRTESKPVNVFSERMKKLAGIK